VVLLGIALFKDQASATRTVGIALIVLGMFGQVAWASAGFTSGHLILGLTGIMWASYTVIIRKSGIAALHATALVAAGSALVYLPIYAFALPKRFFDAPVPDILLQAGFQGVLVSVLAVYAFSRSTELLGAVIGSTLPALIPLVTLLLGAIILGEPSRPNELAIALTIGAGVALILVRRQPGSSQSQNLKAEPQ
jgi:drug/metabolite transporter (DMT)-like permease